MTNKVGAVLIVGGGISGMQAALDLADGGFKVYLVEKTLGIGGIMAQLDKTFPTNDCAMCTIAPRLVDVGNHRNINILCNTDILSLTGETGNFKLKLRKKPTYIIYDKCTGCGACATDCPRDAIDAYNQELTLRRAVYIPYPQSIPKKYGIDKDKCIGCGLCHQRCEAGAVDFTQHETVETINAGAVIFAPGLTVFKPYNIGAYGYRTYLNVVTNIEFERILSSTGPFESVIARPSDGKIPKKICFIQCVGSRDAKTNSYCSSICCSVAIKQAIITKEHDPHTDISIFYMDIRTIAKGAEEYYLRGRDKYDIKFIRCRVSSIEEDATTKDLYVRYVKDNENITERFDMVVLGMALIPQPEIQHLCKNLGISIDEYKFCTPLSVFDPTSTVKSGIYVSGSATEPKDIPDAVSAGSAAASKSAALLRESRGTMVTEKTYPPEIDVVGQEPRIGVFVCHCGTNIGAVVDVPDVVEYAKSLPSVAYAERNLYTCSTDTQTRIIDIIKRYNLNRVVVASCTPRTHEPLFQNTIRDAGLNPYLFEMANIRDQCSWVHTKEPLKATEKAKDLVRMAVGKSRLLKPLYKRKLNMERQSAVVIGGGVAGLTAALDIAEQGFEVDLIEKSSVLGGIANNIHSTHTGEPVKPYLQKIIDSVRKNKNIRIHLNSEVFEKSGHVGNFKIVCRTPNGIETIKCAAIILSVGGEEYKPLGLYSYGQDRRVILQSEFESMIINGYSWKNVVMIQCAGSRVPGRIYCSRICCATAVKNALKLKSLDKDANVYILYRDLRTYGISEKLYETASKSEIIFVNYSEDRLPIVLPSEDGLKVLVRDNILKEDLVIPADVLVLSTGIVPNESSKKLAETLKIPLDENGFFLEAHMKLKPISTSTEGIFLAGICQSPKSISEAILQGSAAASKAGNIIAKGYIEVGGPIAQIDKNKCSVCLTCVRLCPFEAPFINVEGVAEINESKCQGCGICAAECPAKAIRLNHYTDDQVISKGVAAMAI